MVIGLGPLEFEFGGAATAEPLEGVDQSAYSIDVGYRDPPTGYDVGFSREGATEIVIPSGPVPRALLQAALLLLGVGWLVLASQDGWSLYSTMLALFLVYAYGHLAVACLLRTSLAVGDHWLLRRRRVASLPSWDCEFVLDGFEIDNGLWVSGRGSTDRLIAVTRSGRIQLDGTDADGTKAHKAGQEWWPRMIPTEQSRMVPAPGRPPVSMDILQLGQFLAARARVPLHVQVRTVVDPNSSD
jgi:hypothetical protein